MSVGNKASLVLALTVLALAAGVRPAQSQSSAPGLAGPRRSDPPGVAPVPVAIGQSIRLHVACFPHAVGRFPPDPCRGTFMIHDMMGMDVRRGSYNLKPGEVATLEFTPMRDRVSPIDEVGAVDAFMPGDTMLFVPCVVPAPGGRAVPTAEVIDRATGDVALFANVAATRMSDVSNGRGNPGGRVGFNPQPDPPGFGAVTVSSGQVVTMNVACFPHSVNGFPPGPCKGSVMFHDASGRALTDEMYELMPGETMMFEFMDEGPEESRTVVPCIHPDPGGRVVPGVTLSDAMTGKTSLLINPAAPAMSDFQ